MCILMELMAIRQNRFAVLKNGSSRGENPLLGLFPPKNAVLDQSLPNSLSFEPGFQLCDGIEVYAKLNGFIRWQPFFLAEAE